MTDTIEQAVTSVETTVANATGIPESTIAATVTAVEVVAAPVTTTVEAVVAPEVAKVEAAIVVETTETAVTETSEAHSLLGEIEAHIHQLGEGFKIDAEKVKALLAKLRSYL